MPVDSVPLQTLKEAVKAVLETASPRPGKIETRVGGLETWLERRAPEQTFWEISVTAAAEESGGVGTLAWERLTVQIEGYMPFSYANRTEDAWDALVDEVRITLRTYPTLGAAVLGIRGSGLPQLRFNGTRPRSDVESVKMVHYCLIQFEVERRFSYSVSAALP